MSDQIIIAGPASQSLGVKVGNILGAEVISCETKRFPDGECYLRVDLENEEKVKGKDAVIIQTTGASARGDQNRHYMELIMIISAVKRMGAGKIKVIMPYMAYSRQDKVFRPGECKFAVDLLKVIEHAGADEFYTIDIHAPKVFEEISIPAHNLDPMKALADEVNKRGVKNPVVICPDKGAYNRSRDFAKYLGNEVPVAQFEKKRDVKTGEVTMEASDDINIDGMEAIIADDIIATGGTMSLAIQYAKKFGAKEIYAVGTHPLLIKTATYKLLSAGTEEIIGTDTLDSPVMTVSMAQVIADGLKK